MKLIGIAAVILTLLPWAVLAEEVVEAVLAEVNGEVITRYDITVATAESVAALNEKHKGQIPQEELRKTLNYALRSQIERILLLGEAEKNLNERVKAMITQDVDSAIKELVARAGSLTTFQRELEKNGQTLDSKKQRMKEDVMIKYLLNEKVRAWITVSPAEIRRYYQQHGADFEHPASVRFRQILIKVSEYEDRTRAKMAAENILEEIKNGTDFAKLAQQRSHGPESAGGGLWDFIEQGNLPEEIEAVLFSLEPGQVSRVIETDRAYYILKCEEKKSARTESFDEVQEKIENIISDDKFQDNLINYLSELRNNAHVTIYSPTF